ncbi:hypothetical protein HZS_7475 [Henneguya salminicola]|uniref:Tumor necrosis factor alpha-induced protein 8-like protein 2 (Trinotate prediction) n=1 Tax=Henneguya salminicola TaxID=69463 RepID=A0A6G3MIY3_HENSL|nr:hypothetical protein HZS_7475 [Henneguya salminicola]
MTKKSKEDQEEEISKQSLKMRLQKKVASGLINKNTVKTFLSENHFKMLEDLYHLLKTENNKTEGKKYVDYLIKIVVKIFILQKNERLTKEEQKTIEKLNQSIQNVVKCLITFWEESELFDVDFLIAKFAEIKTDIMGILKHHLTPKNQNKAAYILDYISNKKRLENIFLNPTPEIQIHTLKVSKDLSLLLETNEI